MITIGIYDHLTAADDDVQHNLICARVPRQHRFQAVRQTCVTARKAHVDQLPARDRHAPRVIPQPCPLSHDRGALNLSFDLRLDRRARAAVRARAPGTGVHLALDHEDLVRLKQKPRLLEHAREKHDVDGSREVLQRRVSHDLALSRHHAAHLAHQPCDPHLGVLQGARHLDRLRVGEPGKLSGDAPQRVIAQVEAQQLFLEPQLFVACHRGDIDRQTVVVSLGLRRSNHFEQRRLPRLAIAAGPLGPADGVVQRRDQPRPLAQRVTRTRLDQRLQHSPVDVLDRRSPLAKVLERLERAVGVAHGDDALHGVPADVLDRG